MGWEVRHGRRYLYRSRRVNGKSVKQYLAADDRFGFGKLAALELAVAQEKAADRRRAEREADAVERARVDGLLTVTAAANADLRAAAEAVLVALGYRKHNRGEWRMRRELVALAERIGELRAQAAGPVPLIRYEAPDDDAAAVALFAAVRAGDPGARDKLAALIRDRDWVEWLGDLGRQATRQLIRAAAGGDAVWEAGLAEKVGALREELLGPSPTALEQLLVRRVVNGWVATHALELELAVRPPTKPRDRAHLDAALTRAQKRLTDAARELARVRRLQAPTILAQLNVAAAQTVVNGG